MPVYTGGLLIFGGIGYPLELQQKLIAAAHDSPIGEHTGLTATCNRLLTIILLQIETWVIFVIYELKRLEHGKMLKSYFIGILDLDHRIQFSFIMILSDNNNNNNNDGF